MFIRNIICVINQNVSLFSYEGMVLNVLTCITKQIMYLVIDLVNFLGYLFRKNLQLLKDYISLIKGPQNEQYCTDTCRTILNS